MNNSANFDSFVARQNIELEILKFTLELYDQRLLSRAAIDVVMNHVDSLISKKIIPYLQLQVQSELNKKEEEEVFYKVFHVLDCNKNFFSLFDTEHKRLNYYKEKCSYVPPSLYEMGEINNFDKVDSKNPDVGRDVRKKKVYGAYVPMAKTLQAVFSKTHLFFEMEKYIESKKDINDPKSNMTQWEIWRSQVNKDLAKQPRYPLEGYSDDFEPRGPLSSHAGEQKLTGVYFSLPGLPPHLVSKSDNVYLSSLFNAKYLKDEGVGHKSAFKKFIEDGNILSDQGIELQVNGELKRVYFDCVLFLGDNLALNSTLGFSESFSSVRYCRFCYADKQECECMFRENEELIRKKENYERDISLKNVQLTDRKKRCILHDWKFFHTYVNSSVDVMHDLFEGVSAYTLARIIDWLIKNGYIDLETLNNRIASFPFNDTEKSHRPMPIIYETSKKGNLKIKIKQSSAELLFDTIFWSYHRRQSNKRW